MVDRSWSDIGDAPATELVGSTSADSIFRPSSARTSPRRLRGTVGSRVDACDSARTPSMRASMTLRGTSTARSILEMISTAPSTSSATTSRAPSSTSRERSRR